MKKTKIDNSNVVVLKNIDKTIIRKYKVKGLNGYPRTVPQNKILKILEGSNVRHPKLIKNGFRYVDIENIEGRTLYDTTDINVVISTVCNFIFEMHKINCEPIKKYAKWLNNSSFLYFQVNNLLAFVRKTKNIEKFKKMGIDFAPILALKNIRLDDQRGLSLIHGNIRKNNIIEHNGEYTLIDWELATYGDIAYELAMHFVDEEYSQENMNVVIDRLALSLNLNQINLSKDINYYINFEYYRKSILGFNEAIKLKHKKENYDDVLAKTYHYYSKLPNYLSIDKLREVIEEK